MDQPGSHTLIRGNQPAADRMRELLARTVQDQFTDQRSNAGALEDIRQRMEGLEWLVKEVREREVPGMTTQLEELARHLDESTQKPPQWAESLGLLGPPGLAEQWATAANSQRPAAASGPQRQRAPGA